VNFHSKKQERSPPFLRKLFRRGRRAEEASAIDFYELEIANLDKKIISKQSLTSKFSTTGFVTFNNVSSALLCAQARHDLNQNTMEVVYAPDAKDVMWQNLTLKHPWRVIHKIGIIAALVLLFLFWTIPVAFIGAFTNLESLSRIPALKFLDDILEYSPLVRGVIQGFLAALALTVFMALLPKILRGIFWFQRYELRSQWYRSVCITYWLFLLLNVFLVITISGSVSRALKDVIDHPTEVPQILAMTLPSQALFYINYTLISAFITQIISFMQIFPFIGFVFRNLLAKTSYERESSVKLRAFSFHQTYATNLLIFTVGITYSVMAPLILPAVFLYFIIAYFKAKYHFLFQHKPDFDGSHFMNPVLAFICTALFIFQLTMFGLFGLFRFPVGSGVTLAVFIMTIIFTYLMWKRFHRPTVVPPLLDMQGGRPLPYVRNIYYPPALLEPLPLYDGFDQKYLIERRSWREETDLPPELP